MMSFVNFNSVFFAFVVVEFVFQDIFNMDVCFRSDEEYRDAVSFTVLYDDHIDFSETLIIIRSRCQ